MFHNPSSWSSIKKRVNFKKFHNSISIFNRSWCIFTRSRKSKARKSNLEYTKTDRSHYKELHLSFLVVLVINDFRYYKKSPMWE